MSCEVFTKACRLCANIDNYCVSIFGKDGDERRLRYKMQLCSPISVMESDVFPKQVCLVCLSTLDVVYDFYQRVKSAQLKLKYMHNKGEKEASEEKKPGLDSDAKRNVKKLCVGGTTFTFPSGSPFKMANESEQSSSIRRETSNPPLPVFAFLSDVAAGISKSSNQCLEDGGDKDNSNGKLFCSLEKAADDVKGFSSDGQGVQLDPGCLIEKPCNESESGIRKLMNSSNVKNALSNESDLDKVLDKPCGDENGSSDQAKLSIGKSTVCMTNILETEANNIQDPQPSSSTEVHIPLSKPLRVYTRLPTTRPTGSNPPEDDSMHSLPKKPIKPEPLPGYSTPNKRTNSTNEESTAISFKKCRHCDKEFLENILPQHENLHIGKTVYTCAECDGFFLNEATFLKHRCSPVK